MTICIDGRLGRYLSTCVGFQQAFQEGENLGPPALQPGSSRHSASEHADVSGDISRVVHQRHPGALGGLSLQMTQGPQDQFMPRLSTNAQQGLKQISGH